MKMVITNEQIDEFNEILIDRGSALRIEKNKEIQSVQIVLVNQKDVKCYDAYPTKEFYELLEDFFTTKGVLNIQYNNTATSFWEFK